MDKILFFKYPAFSIFVTSNHQYSNNMKKVLYFILASMGSMFSAVAQNVPSSFLNTIQIVQGDSPSVIVEKAAHIVPTANQMNALRDEFIAFIHFGPNTFTRKEWGNGMEDPKIFDLKELDTDQWCKALKSAEIKKVILTVKHHDGFVLWQSRYTKHGIMSTDFQGGKGDILKELSESCRKYGLKLGVYLSPADLYQIEAPSGLYGNLSKYTKRTIPRKVAGRPFANKTEFEFELDDYNEYFMNQLFEILTEYGPVYEVWFDGAHPKTKGGQKYVYKAWKELIHALAPEAVIFGREDIRWCGNEAGATRKTEWNVVPYAENPDTTSTFPDMTSEDLGSREVIKSAKFLHYQPAETNTSIREGWFYRDDVHQKVRSADDVFDIYERAVGGNSIFLLNIPPNRAGKFSPADVNVLKETGARIRETYSIDLLQEAKGPREVLDGNTDTYITLQQDGKMEILLSCPRPVTFNRLVIQEAIAQRGERVEKHAVDAWIDGNWQQIAGAANIGYKRILRFPEVTTDRIRIRILESRLSPSVCNISAHYYRARAPRLAYSRDKQGMVSLYPYKQDFNWKSHGEDASVNLNNGYTIYYTTDGKEPDETSKKYQDPFFMDGGKLKAVAILHGAKGAMLDEQMGFSRERCKILPDTQSSNGHSAELALDANPVTHWVSAGNHHIGIDLGMERDIHGFAYLPVKQKPLLGMRYGVLQVSVDGQQWKDLESFDFGNLENDPSKRYFFLKKQAKARYVRVKSLLSDRNIAIAELDIF